MSASAQLEVSPDYAHKTKLIRPEASLTLGDAVLKWYDLALDEAPVPLSVRALARRNLRDGFKHGELELGGELGFVILHRCGQSFYFLLVSTWRNDNELWETVWTKDGDDAFKFVPWLTAGSHRPTFCVWELGSVCHERQAWSRYLRSERDERAKQEYLADSAVGEV